MLPALMELWSIIQKKILLLNSSPPPTTLALFTVKPENAMNPSILASEQVIQIGHSWYPIQFQPFLTVQSRTSDFAPSHYRGRGVRGEKQRSSSIFYDRICNQAFNKIQATFWKWWQSSKLFSGKVIRGRRELWGTLPYLTEVEASEATLRRSACQIDATF